MKIKLYVALITLPVSFLGCSEKQMTVTEYVKHHGIPHLVAKEIEIEKTENGLREVVVRSAFGQITNSEQTVIFTSGAFLYANSADLKWSIEDYYLERTNNLHFSIGMYYPTRSWFGEPVTIVRVDHSGNVRAVIKKKVHAVVIVNEQLTEPKYSMPVTNVPQSVRRPDP